jgi:hypothetical protein
MVCAVRGLAWCVAAHADKTVVAAITPEGEILGEE